MKICVAQTRPYIGNIKKNMDTHKKLIDLAVSQGTDLITFPELSLTGYEPQLAQILSTNLDDTIFDSLQETSDKNQITIGVGIPTTNNSDTLISMIIFRPNKPRLIYSKQYLHSDEYPYFTHGDSQVYITVHNKKIAPAICYESLLIKHSENVFKNGADIYLTSVAKSVKGIEKAFKHYPEIANKFSMTILMANCVGFCDTFESVGTSSIWNSKGNLVGQLDNTSEGILIFDTNTQEVFRQTI